MARHLIEEGRAAELSIQFRLHEGDLLGGEILAFGVGQKAIGASDNMLQMECYGCNSPRAGPQFLVAQIARPALQVFLGQFAGVQHRTLDGRNVSQRAAQPGFRKFSFDHVLVRFEEVPFRTRGAAGPNSTRLPLISGCSVREQYKRRPRQRWHLGLPEPSLYALHVQPSSGRSPTTPLYIGLIITLLAVVGYSWYVTGRIASLRALQKNLIDRNRRDSLQLLRIQNELNSIGMSMRDMLERNAGESGKQHSMAAWRPQFERMQVDLQDAFYREQDFAPVARTPEQQEYLVSSLRQFWDEMDRAFYLAQNGREKGA